MIVYILTITNTTWTPTKTYIDSVWENEKDAYNHIELCREKGIFDENDVPQIIRKELYKHIG